MSRSIKEGEKKNKKMRETERERERDFTKKINAKQLRHSPVRRKVGSEGEDDGAVCDVQLKVLVLFLVLESGHQRNGG